MLGFPYSKTSSRVATLISSLTDGMKGESGHSGSRSRANGLELRAELGSMGKPTGGIRPGIYCTSTGRHLCGLVSVCHCIRSHTSRHHAHPSIASTVQFTVSADDRVRFPRIVFQGTIIFQRTRRLGLVCLFSLTALFKRK